MTATNITELRNGAAPSTDRTAAAADGFVTVGLDARQTAELRLALGDYALTVGNEFPTADAAVDSLRNVRTGPRVIITNFTSRDDERGLRRLNAALAGWPVVALVDVQSEPENLFWANRAGAAQLVPLPLDGKDLRAALDAVRTQFNLKAGLATTIAFTPASGGCGSSTLAAVAAYETAALGRRTLLIELAPYMGVLATNLNLAPKLTMPDLVERADDLDLYLLRNAVTPAGDNLSVIPGPPGMMPEGWLSRRRVDKIVELARQMADVVILDVAPTFNAFQFERVNAADHAVLICQQSIAAVRALRLLLESLGSAKTDARHLVLNLFDPAVQGLRAEDIERVLGVTGLRPVPRDTNAMLAAVNRGQPLRQVAPHSPVLKAVSGLVNTILGGAHAAAPTESGFSPASSVPSATDRWTVTETVVRLLHVEDEPTQHKVLMIRLRSAAGMRFEPTWVTGQDAALAAYGPDKFDLVIMDYMLEQGNGLHLLQELRLRDPFIPVIAISGVAPSAVALDLIRAGADDYFDKTDLDTRLLVKSIRESLDRATNIKKRTAGPVTFGTAVAELCRDFAGRLGPEFSDRLNGIETLARQADATEANLVAELSEKTGGGGPRDSLLRFVVLELGLRLFGTPGEKPGSEYGKTPVRL